MGLLQQPAKGLPAGRLFCQAGMMASVFKRLLLMACGAMLPGLVAAESGSLAWVFEGRLSTVDPALVPDLQAGWILSGSFLLEPGDWQAAEGQPDGSSGRFEGGLQEGELTIDLYHQAHFEARQVPGLAGLDYQVGSPDSGQRDLLGWFIPIRGTLKETGWGARWLQVWLAHEAGGMLEATPPSIPRDGLAWQTGWFRLTFANAASETAVVDGTLTVFSPLGSAGSREPDWEAVVGQLGEELLERDRQIEDLQQQLGQALARLESLRGMVDLLMEERSLLQADADRLRQQAERASPAAEAAVAGLTVDNALLQEEVARLTRANSELDAQLEGFLREKAAMEARILQLEQSARFTAEARHRSVKIPAEAPQPDRSGIPERTPDSPPGSVSAKVASPAQPAAARPAPPRQDPAPRQLGPRKFR